jgi:hypothetical protein
MLGDVTMAHVLLEGNSGPRSIDGSALWIIANQRYGAKMLRECRIHNIDIDQRLGSCGSVLCYAIYSDNLRAATALIKSGANVNARCILHSNVLTCAIKHGNSSMVDVLLVAGAAVNPEGLRKCQTPICVALRKRNLGAAQLLLFAGAQVLYCDCTTSCMEALQWRDFITSFFDAHAADLYEMLGDIRDHRLQWLESFGLLVKRLRFVSDGFRDTLLEYAIGKRTPDVILAIMIAIEYGPDSRSWTNILAILGERGDEYMVSSLRTRISEMSVWIYEQGYHRLLPTTPGIYSNNLSLPRSKRRYDTDAASDLRLRLGLRESVKAGKC